MSGSYVPSGVFTFQMLIVLSPGIDTTRSPSASRATRTTLAVTPFSVRTSRPVAKSQTRSVLSTDADTACRPSGAAATRVTAAE